MNRSQLPVKVLVGSLVSALLCAQPIAAQVVPDDTLPAGERSQVTGNPDFQVDGGARRGGNLFHSFDQFSVPTGGSAYFNNAADVQNIFSRVTGRSASNIDGLIRANGTANLFLLNPNGILFGPNASLNVGGSFVGTTANAIGFPNGEIFSSDATQPLPSQLLNVNPNALFFNQLAAQSIVNQSTANNGTGLQVPEGQSLLLVGGVVGLDGGQIVSPGSRVELGAVAGQGVVGLSETSGDWRLDFPNNLARADIDLSNSAQINVRAGGGGSIAMTARNLTLNQGIRIRAGIDSGLGFAGAQAGDIQLNVTEAINAANDIIISNVVLPSGTGNAGNISITTGSLAFISGSRLTAYTAGQGNAGNVNINARDTVSFDSGYVLNNVAQTGIGNTGGINITTGSLALIRGASLDASTSGQGNAGSVNINARDTVSLDGKDSAIFNDLEQTGIGNPGGINITTGSLALIRGGQLIARTSGQGNASNITINARDRVFVDGESLDGGLASAIFSRVTASGVGRGGSLVITTGSLSLTNGGAINTATIGRGNASSVTIQARDSVEIRGRAVITPELRSGIFTTATVESVGDGGDVTITTGSLSVSDEGRIITDVRSQGNAGDIRIQASDTVSFDRGDAISTLSQGGVGRGGDIDITGRSLSILNGAQLATSTRGQGDAGNVTINTRDTVALIGSDRTSPSAITTQVEAGAVGTGGRINITTGSVSLTRGAQLVTTTSSQGRAGNISINARDRVTVSGADSNYGDRIPPTSEDEASVINVGPASGLFANTEVNSTGEGGDIRVATGQLTVEAGGRLVASTAGQRNAGDIQVRATNGVMLSGTSPSGFSSGLLTDTERTSTGRGGAVQVDTAALQVDGGAVLSARSSSIARGGEIIVNADTVDLTRGGQLLTTAFSSGQAGNITVNARDRVHISGSDATFAARLARVGRPTVDSVNAASGVFTNTEANSSGAGGAIALTTGSLSLLNGGRLVASTAGGGDAGDITVNSSNLRLFGASSGLFAQTSTTADAGNLTIQPQGNGQSVTVQLQEGAQISASTSNRGRGGRLTITAPESVTLTGNGSIISAETSGRGTGGNLNFDTGTLTIQDQAEVTVSSSGAGRAGSLFVDADRIFLNNQGSIRADTSGGGGNINLRSPLIVLRNGSNITTNATGSNIPGGNIDIDTRFLIAVPTEDSNISANSEDFRGGNVSINAVFLYGIQPSLTSTPLSDITATGATSALPGTIDVTTVDTEPTAGLFISPTDLIDYSQLIAQGCPADQGNSFVISGRGGLPPNPEQQLDDDADWQDRRRLVVPQQQADSRRENRSQIQGGEDTQTPRHREFSNATSDIQHTEFSSPTPASVSEATGWQVAPDGEIVLVANSSIPDGQNSLNHPTVCPRR